MSETPQGRSTPDPAETPALLVETPAALEALAVDLRSADTVALDIEANSLHAYRERACVMQMTAGATSWIVDILALPDLSPVREALDRNDVEIVLHGGDYDVAVLSRDHAFRFHRVFDTMIAATLLGDEKLGLANLVWGAYEVELDKRFQRVDWGKRPLSPEQIQYLHRDTAYLPGLRDLFGRRLDEADLLEEADLEFRRLAGRCGKVPTFDPEGWRRIKGTNGLDAQARAVLARLHAWREGEAERRDAPPFKVLPPRVMVELATALKAAPRHPGQLVALSSGLRRRYGKDILPVVRQGHEDAEANLAPARSLERPPTAEERAERKRVRRFEEQLRAWRKEEATTRGVPNLVVLPNRALAWLARERPSEMAPLANHPDIGPKRAARYGAAMLAVLDQARGDSTSKRPRKPG